MRRELLVQLADKGLVFTTVGDEQPSDVTVFHARPLPIGGKQEYRMRWAAVGRCGARMQIIAQPIFRNTALSPTGC
jgi:hypothetical protein